MKILILDNSSLTPVDNDFCIHPRTGSFVKELKDLRNHVAVYGQIVKKTHTTHTFKLIDNGINVVGLKRKKNKLINYIILYLRIIPEIISNDFVYIFYPTAFKYVAFLCWFFRTKYGIYIRGQQDLEDKSSQLIYKKANVVFTVTSFFTERVKKLTTMNNSYTIRPMIPFTDKDINLERRYPTIAKHKVLFLGRVTFDKGIRELLEATKKIKTKDYAFELIIVGDGEFMTQTKEIIEDYNISDIVTLIGAIHNEELVAQYFTDATIYILPTYHEGFPRTLYESMIFGTPIITTFVGGIPGLMKDEYNCKKIEPKSVDSIVEALEYAFNNYDKMIEFAKNGFETVRPIIDSKLMSHAEQLNKIIKREYGKKS